MDEPRFATLATIAPDGSPRLTVMWYRRDGDEILFNTALGRRKPEDLERDPRVALMVHEGLRFVRLSGRARLVADGPEALEDIVALARRYQGDAAGERSRAAFARDRRVSYRFRIRRAYLSDDLR